MNDILMKDHDQQIVKEILKRIEEAKLSDLYLVIERIKFDYEISD